MTTALAPMGDAELARMGPEQIEEEVGRIQRAADTHKRMVKAALTLTQSHDWQIMGDKLYLEGEGAQRLLRVGISLSEPKFAKDVVDDNVFVRCSLTATWPAVGVTVTEIGTADTLDKFWDNENDRCFANQCRERAGNNEKVARQMMVGHVEKKALMNATSRVVTAVMGIRGLTLEDLADLGVTPETAGSNVRYREKATRKDTKKSSTKNRLVTVEELLTLPIDTRVMLNGTIQKATKWDNRHQYEIAQDGKTVQVYVVTTDDPPDFAKQGANVHFPEIKVGEYRGNRQYTAWGGIESCEDEGDDGVAS